MWRRVLSKPYAHIPLLFRIFIGFLLTQFWLGLDNATCQVKTALLPHVFPMAVSTSLDSLLILFSETAVFSWSLLLRAAFEWIYRLKLVAVLMSFPVFPSWLKHLSDICSLLFYCQSFIFNFCHFRMYLIWFSVLDFYHRLPRVLECLWIYMNSRFPEFWFL